jgi:predicted RecB family nuclease
MDETRDITRVWMVAPEHRNRAFKKSVKRWDDKRCNADMLGFTGDKSPRRKTVQEILNINQQDREIIRPRTIQDNRCRWQTRYPTDFYIDYETINESYIKLEDRINIHNSKLLSGYIFMIGVGYEVDGEWKFKSFTCRDYTLDEEKRIVGEFQEFVKEEKKRVDPQDEYPIRFFHWAHVEKTLLESFFQRSNTVWRDYCEIRWVDMCSVFTSNPIVVKGALTFKLKDIAKALYKAGLIRTSWTDDKMSDGMMAMTTAIDYYFGDRNRDIMDSIERYNMIDCKVIWEIVACLRKQTSI